MLNMRQIICRVFWIGSIVVHYGNNKTVFLGLVPFKVKQPIAENVTSHPDIFVVDVGSWQLLNSPETTWISALPNDQERRLVGAVHVECNQWCDVILGLLIATQLFCC